MRSTPILLAVLLVIFVGKCLGGHDDTKMYALRDAFEAAGSLPSSWSGGVSGDSCGWPGVTCFGEYVTELRLFNDQLTSLPPEIGSLTSLEYLHLNENQLTSLPSEIGSLTSLESLNFDGNQLTSVLPEIGSLPSLKTLQLNHNQLTSLPSEIGSLTSLEQLQFNENQLTSVPSEIGSLTSLERLDLGGNQLTSLPSEIGSLTSLESLNFDGNQLTSVLPEIGSLPSLKTLQLNHNQLTSLPSEIGSLTSLEQLHLNENQLTSVPSEIGSLTSLEQLHLNENQLTSLPSEIGSLTSLEQLYLYNNQLTSLPDTIWSLPSLTYLDIRDNAKLCVDVPDTFSGTVSDEGCCVTPTSFVDDVLVPIIIPIVASVLFLVVALIVLSNNKVRRKWLGPLCPRVDWLQCREERERRLQRAIELKRLDSLDVFVSYSWSNQAEVRRLRDALEDGGYKVWMDEKRMRGGDLLFNEIAKGVRGCKVFVCCVSDSYAKSDNCQRELSLASNLKKVIRPVLVSELKKGWPPEGSVGFIIGPMLYDDLSTPEKLTSGLPQLVGTVGAHLK